jgi:hypothetical protein
VETTGIRHWSGTTAGTLYTISGGTLRGITAIDSSNAWAVGQTTGGRPFIQHWDGTSWSSVSSPSFLADSFLNSIDFSSLGRWAVGSYYNPLGHYYQTLIEYYDGTSWRIVPSYNNQHASELRSVWVTTSDDVWATGTYEYPIYLTQQPLILHWTGYQWIQSNSPNLNDNGLLLGITSQTSHRPYPTYTVNPAVSDWAVGSYQATSGSQQTLVEHISAPTPPGVTTSYYELQVTPTVHQGQGCQAAQTPVSGVVILDGSTTLNRGRA